MNGVHIECIEVLHTYACSRYTSPAHATTVDAKSLCCSCPPIQVLMPMSENVFLVRKAVANSLHSLHLYVLLAHFRHGKQHQLASLGSHCTHFFSIDCTNSTSTCIRMCYCVLNMGHYISLRHGSANEFYMCFVQRSMHLKSSERTSKMFSFFLLSFYSRLLVLSAILIFPSSLQYNTASVGRM